MKASLTRFQAITIYPKVMVSLTTLKSDFEF